MEDSTNTTSIIERGDCFVCDPVSSTILLIQASVFLAVIIIQSILISPLVKMRGIVWAQSEMIRSRFTGFGVLWTLCLIIHATLKWFADPWTTHSPPKGNEDENFGSKHVWVGFVTNCFNIVALVGFFTAMTAGNWLIEKLLRKFGMEKNAEGLWERRVNQHVTGEDTPLREEGLIRSVVSRN